MEQSQGSSSVATVVSAQLPQRKREAEELESLELGRGRNPSLLKVIRKIFPTCVSLLDFLNLKLKGSLGSSLLSKNDPADYQQLLQNVCVLQDINESATDWKDIILPKAFSAEDASSPAAQHWYADTINNIINQLVHDNKPNFKNKEEQNCFCLGYRLKAMGGDSASMKNFLDMECHYVNSGVALIMSPAWRLLGCRIGEKAMTKLLERPVFVPSKNGSFLQVSGTPAGQLAYHKRQVDDTNHSNRSKKMKIISNTNLEGQGDFKRSYSNQTSSSSAVNGCTVSSNQKTEQLIYPNSFICGTASIPRMRMLYNMKPFKAALPSNHEIVQVILYLFSIIFI